MSATIVEPVKKPLQQLVQSRIKLADTIRNVWAVNATIGTTRNELVDPAYWAHVSGDFSQFDRIEVRAEDGSFFAELLVLASGRSWAHVHEVTFVDLVKLKIDKIQDSMSEYSVEWRGIHLKHCAVRKSDNAVIKDGFPSKLEGQKFLKQHEATLAK